jgi:hypothetical protein
VFLHDISIIKSAQLDGKKCNNMNDLFLGEESISSDKEATTTGRSTSSKLQPPKRDQVQSVHFARGGNRFGFRQNNVVRPTSGFTPKFNDFDKVNNNTTQDRRSKSATATSRTAHVAFAQPSVKTINEQPVNSANASLK